MPKIAIKPKEIVAGPFLSVEEMVQRIQVSFAMPVASKRRSGKSQ